MDAYACEMGVVCLLQALCEERSKIGLWGKGRKEGRSKLGFALAGDARWSGQCPLPLRTLRYALDLVETSLPSLAVPEARE